MTWYVEHAAFLDHWDDLISDFSALHRVHTPLEWLPATWLWPMAERLGAYAGVMRARAENTNQGSGPTSQRSTTSTSRPSTSGPTAHQDSQGRHVQPVRDFRPDDPLLKGYVETSHHKATSRKGT